MAKHWRRKGGLGTELLSPPVLTDAGNDLAEATNCHSAEGGVTVRLDESADGVNWNVGYGSGAAAPEPVVFDIAGVGPMFRCIVLDGSNQPITGFSNVLEV